MRILHGSIAIGAMSIVIAALSLVPATAEVVFRDDFGDFNAAGWTLWPEWQIGPSSQSANQAFGFPDPASDQTPTTDNAVAGAIIGGNITSNLHDFYYFMSPAIDLSGVLGTIELSFYRWLNSDYSPYMQNVVDVFDGVSWVNLWTSGGQPAITDSVWTLVAMDVTPYKNAAFRVRFGHAVLQAGAYTVSGWNIDDVSLIANQVTAVEPAASSFDVRLHAPSPNPSKQAATISFDTPRPGVPARLAIFDLSGRHVSTLFDGTAPSGRSTVLWTGTDASGHALASGVYVIALDAGGRQMRQRLTIVK